VRADTASRTDLPRYRLFGVTVASSFPFETPLSRTDRAADVTFTCSRDAPPDLTDPGGEPVFTSRGRLPGGAPVLVLYRGAITELIRYTEVADFYLADDRIYCHLLDPTYDFMVELHLLGLVFSYWFERQGIPMLHASAVVVDGRAAVFVATNKGGKSSLACALMDAGHPLLSDDVVGLQMTTGGLEGRPGFPSMRLWPDQAAHFHGEWEGLSLAHPRHEKRRVPVGPGGFGSFQDAPAPLAGFYLPERRPASAGLDIDLSPVHPGQAVIELVRGSFVPRLAQEAGFARDRLALFGRLAAAVPVKRLVYPEGNEHLPMVRDAIIQDVRRAAAAGPERSR
jgi:hypothetical protein